MVLAHPDRNSLIRGPSTQFTTGFDDVCCIEYVSQILLGGLRTNRSEVLYLISTSLSISAWVAEIPQDLTFVHYASGTRIRLATLLKASALLCSLLIALVLISRNRPSKTLISKLGWDMGTREVGLIRSLPRDQTLQAYLERL